MKWVSNTDPVFIFLSDVMEFMGIRAEAEGGDVEKGGEDVWKGGDDVQKEGVKEVER